jgi:hypothetical protein
LGGWAGIKKKARKELFALCAVLCPGAAGVGPNALWAGRVLGCLGCRADWKAYV